MARVVIDVMLKPEILDTQGQAVAGACERLGFAGVSEVRQGKRFEVDFEDAAEDEALDRAHRLAETLLANPVIEDFDLRLA